LRLRDLTDRDHMPDPCQNDRSWVGRGGEPRGVGRRFPWWRTCSSGLIAEIPLAVWELRGPALATSLDSYGLGSMCTHNLPRLRPRADANRRSAQSL
jgi:hypothetical protein